MQQRALTIHQQRHQMQTLKWKGVKGHCCRDISCFLLDRQLFNRLGFLNLHISRWRKGCRRSRNPHPIRPTKDTFEVSLRFSSPPFSLSLSAILSFLTPSLSLPVSLSLSAMLPVSLSLCLSFNLPLCLSLKKLSPPSQPTSVRIETKVTHSKGKCAICQAKEAD